MREIAQKSKSGFESSHEEPPLHNARELLLSCDQVPDQKKLRCRQSLQQSPTESRSTLGGKPERTNVIHRQKRQKQEIELFQRLPGVHLGEDAEQQDTAACRRNNVFGFCVPR